MVEKLAAFLIVPAEREQFFELIDNDYQTCRCVMLGQLHACFGVQGALVGTQIVLQLAHASCPAGWLCQQCRSSSQFL
jgi:hypothetical protein